MASEFIEIISEQTKAQIDAIMPLVEKLANKIKDINNFQPANTPSGADSAIKKLTEDYAKQSKEIENLKNKLASLNEEGRKKAVITTQQKVDNAIILKQEKQQATLTSAYADAYAKLNAQRTIAKTKLQDLIASERASNSEIRKAQKEFDVLNKKVAAADKAVGRFSDANRKINGLASSVGNLMTAFGVGTGIYLAMDIGKSIYNTTKELQSLNLALKMVSGTNQEYAENQSFVQQVSEKWGLEVKSLTQQYTQFYTASKGLLSQEAIKTTFEGIAKAGSVMGLSLEKQKDAFYAIDQMMSKGNVTAEELKKQLGNAMPGAIKAAAMAYQELHPQIKTIQEAEKGLYEAMKKGALDSATYVPLIVKNLNKIYGIEMLDKVETLQANQNRLQNSWTDLVKSLNNSETGGISQFFSLIIKGATEAMISLKRLNSSKEELFKESRDKGKTQGQQAYKKQFDELVGDKLTTEKRNEIRKQIKETENLIKLGYDLTSDGEKTSDKLRRLHQSIGTGTAEEVNLTLRKDAYKNILIQQKKLNELQAESNNYSTLLGGKKGRGMNFIIKEREEANRLLGYYEGISKSAINYKEEIKPKVNGEGETEKEKKARLKAERDANKEREQIAKESYEAELSNLERQKELISDLKEVEETSLEDKLFLEQAYAYKQIQIAQFIYDEKVRIADKEIKERKLTSVEGENLKTPLNNELQTSIENSKSESLSRMNKLTEENLKKEDEKTKEWYKNNPPFFVENEDSKKAREETVKLNQKALEDVKNYITSFQIELGQNLGFDETANFFLKMDTDGRTMFDKLNSMADGSKEKQIATFQAIAESAQETFNFIANASQKNFDEEYARLEKEKDARLAFAGDSDTAKKKIEEDYEKRRKEIAIREFKAKQKMAIVNIAIDTAQAVMAVSAKAQWWQVPLMIALGAVQAGIVASQKVPEYWKGTGNALEGLAFTQERGAEIITDKKGVVKDFGDNKGARLTMMEQGDKVYTADQTKRMMFNKDLNSIMTDNGIANAPQIIVNSQGMTEQQMESVMMRTLGSMAVESTVIDANGFKQVISKGHSRTIEHTARITGRGLKIGR